jgi:hypothetical protein
MQNQNTTEIVETLKQIQAELKAAMAGQPKQVTQLSKDTDEGASAFAGFKKVNKPALQNAPAIIQLAISRLLNPDPDSQSPKDLISILKTSFETAAAGVKPVVTVLGFQFGQKAFLYKAFKKSAEKKAAKDVELYKRCAQKFDALTKQM